MDSKRKFLLLFLPMLLGIVLPLDLTGQPPVSLNAEATINDITLPQEKNIDNRQALIDREDRVRSLTAFQMFFTALPLAFGLLHLIFYLFFKEARENLYFAIFLFFYSASIFFDYQQSLFGDVEHTILYIRIHRAVQPFYLLFALRFVYSLFYSKLPKQFWLLTLLLIVPGIYAVFYPSAAEGYKYFNYAAVPVTVEIIRVIVNAVRQKKSGAWIIATGFFIYFVFSTFDTLMDLIPEFHIPFREMENPYAFGTVGFLITMSVYLARRYVRAYEGIIEHQRREKQQEIELRLLEADNTRKTRELDEARRLQLTMLPKCVSEIPGLDICFHMEPATEVGGDYYDYLIDRQGGLVLAVGDATGHGMKAGIMVATIKSLFHTNGANPHIPEFFKLCTATIKQMHMGNLYMALSLIRINGNTLVASSAGMPPILVYQAGSDKVEELRIKGPPLGAFAGFSYTSKERILEPGDTVLLMSDGLAELFDEADQMMGYDRIKDAFKEIALRDSTAVVAHLSASAKRWRQNRSQEDDITLVAVKFKGTS